MSNPNPSPLPASPVAAATALALSAASRVYPSTPKGTRSSPTRAVPLLLADADDSDVPVLSVRFDPTQLQPLLFARCPLVQYIGAV